MDEEILKADPYSKTKKITMVFLVSIMGLAIISTFLIFGKLLGGYFETDKWDIRIKKQEEQFKVQKKDYEEQLNSQRKDIETQIEKAKTQLKQLEENIAEREKKIMSRQEFVDDFNVWFKKVSDVKKDYQKASDELKNIRQNIAEQNGTVSGIKVELSALSTLKLSLQNDLSELNKSKNTVEIKKSQLSNEITELDRKKSDTTEKTLAIEKIAREADLNVANQIKKVENAKEELAQLEAKISEIKTTQNNLSAQNTLADEAIKRKILEAKELESSIYILKKKKEELTINISALEDQKIKMETQVNELEKKLEQAKTKIETTTNKNKISQAGN